MKRLAFLGAMSFFFCMGVGTAVAHDCDHHGHYYHDDCWGCGRYSAPETGRRSMNMGSPAAVVDPRTLEGRIGEILYLPGPTPESGMVEIRVVSGNQTSLVRLAPSGYLTQNGMILREGETVTLRGFLVAGMEGSLIVATEIHHHGRSLALRDGGGRPAW